MKYAKVTRRTLCVLPIYLYLAAACSPQPPSRLSWDAESADNEANSTHLWIVNRALDILGRHADLEAASWMAEKLQAAGCRTAWQQGLLDADFLAVYNNGWRDIHPGVGTVQIGLAGTSWKSHFFDPGTGRNYLGETSPTAYTEALRFVPDTADPGWTTTDGGEAEKASCYALGVSLHYFTDVTQPMHTANYSALARPLGLHSNLEGYAMTIQDRYRAADWSNEPLGTLADHILTTAQVSKGLWPSLKESIAAAYDRSHDKHPLACNRLGIPAANFLIAQEVDHSLCWRGDAAVDAGVGQALTAAQDRTAQYLYLIGARAFGSEDNDAP